MRHAWFQPGRPPERPERAGGDLAPLPQRRVVGGEVGGRGVPIGGLLRHALHADRAQVRTDPRVQPVGRNRVGGSNRVEHRRERRPVCRRAPGEQLVKDRAEAEHVGGDGELTGQLLRGHVRRGAGYPPVGAVERNRQAEVGDERFALVVEQHVGRLQVAVQESAAVRVVDGVGHLFEYFRGAVRLANELRDPVGQRSAGAPVHREIRRFVAARHVQNADDVGVPQPGHRLGLGPEPRPVARPGPQQHFHGHLTRQAQLPRPVHDTHVPADPVQKLVVAQDALGGRQVRLPRRAPKGPQPGQCRVVEEVAQLGGELRVAGQPLGRRQRPPAVPRLQVLSDGRPDAVLARLKGVGVHAPPSDPPSRAASRRLPRNSSPPTPLAVRPSRAAVSASGSSRM